MVKEILYKIPPISNCFKFMFSLIHLFISSTIKESSIFSKDCSNRISLEFTEKIKNS